MGSRVLGRVVWRVTEHNEGFSLIEVSSDSSREPESVSCATSFDAISGPRTSTCKSAGISLYEIKILFQAIIQDFVVFLYAKYGEWLTKFEKLHVTWMLTRLLGCLNFTSHAEPDTTDAGFSAEAYR